MEYLEIGRRIKERRQELNISAVELADMLGLSKATVHRYENGDIRNIKLPVVESMARALRANPLWIIGKSDQKEADSMCEKDLLVMIDELIAYAKRTSYLTVNGKALTGEQKNMVVSSLTLLRAYLSDI